MYIGCQIDCILTEHFAQVWVIHSCFDARIDNVFAHVTRADAVIDAIVEPIAGVAQDRGHVRFAQTRHSKNHNPFVRGGGPCVFGWVKHCEILRKYCCSVLNR